MVGKSERDIDRDQQRLVGDRVEIGAELGVPAIALGKEAVGRVGQTREQEHEKCRQHLVRDDQPYHQRDEHNPPEREDVGDVHRCSSRQPRAPPGASSLPALDFTRFLRITRPPA